MEFNKAKKFVWNLLETKLPSYLTYHGIIHTEKVLDACIAIAKEENITKEEELVLLKTAALFHDCGFTKVYDEHEAEGCTIAKETLPWFDYSDSQIKIICDMIMKTKLPQQPVTQLEKILCDADLYYLGSNSFEKVADLLCEEWMVVKKLKTKKEWNEAQIHFLENHTYWTKSAELSRGKRKTEHLEKLKKSVHQEF